MAPEVGARNVVFRSIEDKWRGPLPCSGPEAAAGLVVGLIATGALNALAGGVLCLAVIAALVGWRRLDHDRSDYLTTFLRRRFRSVRAYNANEPDDRFVPFEPR